jgi:hypothetical protein
MAEESTGPFRPDRPVGNASGPWREFRNRARRHGPRSRLTRAWHGTRKRRTASRSRSRSRCEMSRGYSGRAVNERATRTGVSDGGHLTQHMRRDTIQRRRRRGLHRRLRTRHAAVRDDRGGRHHRRLGGSRRDHPRIGRRRRDDFGGCIRDGGPRGRTDWSRKHRRRRTDHSLRQQGLRVDVPLRIGLASHAEVHIGDAQLGLPTRPKCPDAVAFGNSRVLLGRNGAHMGERHRPAVRCLDRQRLPAAGNGARVRHDPTGRSAKRLPRVAAHVDPAVLSRRVRLRGVERERLEE